MVWPYFYKTKPKQYPMYLFSLCDSVHWAQNADQQDKGQTLEVGEQPGKVTKGEGTVSEVGRETREWVPGSQIRKVVRGDMWQKVLLGRVR